MIASSSSDRISGETGETAAPATHPSGGSALPTAPGPDPAPMPLPSADAPDTAETIGPCALTIRLQRGEAGAFEQLLREHGGPMLATARRMVGNEEDAREVLQEALLSAFRAIGSFHGRCQLSTWLHRVVVNAALMRLRRNRSRPEVAMESLLPRFQDDGHHVEPQCPWSAEAVERVHRAESRALVRAAIDRLPSAYREVILLRDMEDLSTEATGQVLGISSNAVKIRLHRARLALRTLLDPHFRGEDA